MTKPDDWQILAVVLMRRLNGKVELTQDEIAEARELLDPVLHETLLVTYKPSLLTPGLVAVELRSRPRKVPEALDALAREIRGIEKGRCDA